MGENNNQNLTWGQFAALFPRLGPLAPLSANQLNGGRMPSSLLFASMQQQMTWPLTPQLFPTSAIGTIHSASPSPDHLLSLCNTLIKEKTSLQVENDRLRSQLRTDERTDEAHNHADEGVPGSKVRKRDPLDKSDNEASRNKKIQRAADDIRDFCKDRFSDGLYGEMGAAALGHILQHNPHKHEKAGSEKKWKEFLVNVSSKSDIPKIYEEETLHQIQERWRQEEWGLCFLTRTVTTKSGYQKALNLLSKNRVLSKDGDDDEQDPDRCRWVTWHLKYGTAMPTICPRDRVLRKAASREVK